MTRYERRYRRIARTLSRLELMASPADEKLESAEALLASDSAGRFLGYYGQDGLRLALERYGLYEALDARGLHRPAVETREDEGRYTLIVTATEPPSIAGTHLVELVVRRDRLVPDVRAGLPALPGVYDVLTVDWLCMQHPLRSFGKARPRLPGQEASGLGIGAQVAELLYRVVERLRLHALLTVPEYFHTAVFYARELRFFDPWYEGQLRALEAALIGRELLSVPEASWAIEWGCVSDAEGAPFRWHGEAQLRPFDGDLGRYLSSREHEAFAAETASRLRYVLDRPAYEARFREEREGLTGEA